MVHELISKNQISVNDCKDVSTIYEQCCRAVRHLEEPSRHKTDRSWNAVLWLQRDLRQHFERKSESHSRLTESYATSTDLKLRGLGQWVLTAATKSSRTLAFFSEGVKLASFLSALKYFRVMTEVYILSREAHYQFQYHKDSHASFK